MNALSDVLRAVKLTGAVFLDAEFRAPWCIAAQGKVARLLMPAAEHFIHYHYIVDGRCRAKVESADEVQLEAGDVVVFPRGDPHVMGSGLQLAPRRLAEMLPTTPRTGEVLLVEYGGDGEATRVVCGFLACDPRLGNPILTALPPVFKVNLRAGPSGEWLDRSIRHSVAEAASPRAGADVILARLSELLFVETLRSYVETLPAGQTGWLAGSRDPLVGKSLTLLHGRSAHPWTVDELAREVGCSRSVLAERFTHYLGQAPMRYLARWRLALAADLLRSGGLPLARVAEEVGYESEQAFNRAFKREFGVPPARWRRHDEAAPTRPTPAPG
jgi:AraC-like DNA-binding protein/mannose-6-phosphate isomerase-like protein (cupin superfamily)